MADTNLIQDADMFQHSHMNSKLRKLKNYGDDGGQREATSTVFILQLTISAALQTYKHHETHTHTHTHPHTHTNTHRVVL